VRRAQSGDDNSLAWMVTHSTPLLRAQADYRLRGRLRELYDPDDLVDEVWMVFLSRLGDLRPREGHFGPVLVRFLGTTLLNLVNNALRKTLARPRPDPPRTSSDAGPQEDPVDRLPAEITSALARAQRDETGEAIRTALERLTPAEREVVVLRGIEQVSNLKAAEILGAKPSTVAMRYRSALQKLRQLLPNSVFDELP
jgi:RNA polymerase sigma factor (sigma-70 family)